MLAAPSATCTMLLVAMIVMSLPARLMSATPSGMVYSSAGTGPFSLYIILSSKKTTGLSSRMADFNSPLASYGVEGITTFKPGNVAEPGMQRLRVLRGRAARRAQRGAHHHRHFPLSARHVVDFGGLIHHLVHGEADEIAEHDVDHRTHAGHRGAHGDAGESGFGNRRVEHALGAEFFHQAGENFERSARFGDVFAHNEDARVAAHLFGQRLADGLRERQFATAV